VTGVLAIELCIAQIMHMLQHKNEYTRISIFIVLVRVVDASCCPLHAVYVFAHRQVWT
jgi:hypothetical protein